MQILFEGKRNLCGNALFTGYTINGGYAEYTVAYEQYCFRLNRKYANAQGAPLLCAGLIGYRSYSMIDKHAENIGIYGFGAAAHLITQGAIYQHNSIKRYMRYHRAQLHLQEFPFQCHFF
jgi:propanol-preferring alcohol dehydrogenase